MPSRLQSAGAFFIFLSSFVAGVAELVDALDSKSSGSDTVRVRFPPSAPSFVFTKKSCVFLVKTAFYYK